MPTSLKITPEVATKLATRKPTKAELGLLHVLWQHGSATAKRVHELVQIERPEVNQATVLRQLQIMHSDVLNARMIPRYGLPDFKGDASCLSDPEDLVNTRWSAGWKP